MTSSKHARRAGADFLWECGASLFGRQAVTNSFGQPTKNIVPMRASTNILDTAEAKHTDETLRVDPKILSQQTDGVV